MTNAAASCAAKKPPNKLPTFCITRECPVWLRKCQNLYIIVVTTPNWEATAFSPPYLGPNLPPNPCLVSPGLKGSATITGVPTPIPISATDLPWDIQYKYGQGGNNLATVEFTFGSSAQCEFTGNVGGKVIARTSGNCGQASFDFAYAYCGQEFACPGPRFEVLGCTHNRIRFFVIDATTYISTNVNEPSYVIMGLEQFCGSVTTNCDGTVDGCVYAPLPCVVTVTPTPTLPPVTLLLPDEFPVESIDEFDSENVCTINSISMKSLSCTENYVFTLAINVVGTGLPDATLSRLDLVDALTNSHIYTVTSSSLTSNTSTLVTGTLSFSIPLADIKSIGDNSLNFAYGPLSTTAPNFEYVQVGLLRITMYA
jgi:hypothetical protein